jgi:hypothetical protein
MGDVGRSIAAELRELQQRWCALHRWLHDRYWPEGEVPTCPLLRCFRGMSGLHADTAESTRLTRTRPHPLRPVTLFIDGPLSTLSDILFGRLPWSCESCIFAVEGEANVLIPSANSTLIVSARGRKALAGARLSGI